MPSQIYMTPFIQLNKKFILKLCHVIFYKNQNVKTPKSTLSIIKIIQFDTNMKACQ